VARYAAVTRPGSLPGAVLAAWWASWTWYPTLALVVVFTPLLFPTGRLLSPRWRLVAWPAAAVAAAITALAALQQTLELAPGHTVANPFGLAGVENPEDSRLGSVLFPLFGPLVLAAFASLVVRFRRAGKDERQQLKWITFAGALLPLTFLSDLVPDPLSNLLFAVVVALLPAAAGIAILRYRLYDLDRIVSRTVAYGLLTVLLGLGYAAVVLGLGRLLPQGSSLAVAAATLAVAAAFQPARRRIQQAVDRRFNRRLLRRRPHHRGLQRPAPRADRPRHPGGRAAGGRGPDGPADRGQPLAAPPGQDRGRPGPGDHPPAVKVCPNCGEEHRDRARFCLSCGRRLDEPAPTEERKVVTVLFCDLVGFTARSDNADVKAALRPFHARIKREIELFGGTLDKFIGDAALGVFGSPVAHEDDPERAVRAALAIVDAIKELNRLDPALDLAVRTSVNTGEAVVAYGIGPQIGEAVTGDVVNTAARLQHVARWAASSSASPPSGPPTGPCATSRSRPSP
jgi:hypothetical protein